MNKTNIEHPTLNAEHRSRGTRPAQLATFDVWPFAHDRSVEIQMKTPKPKNQIPKRLQISISNREPPQRVWDLMLGISLALGVWGLGIWPATDNEPLNTDNKP